VESSHVANANDGLVRGLSEMLIAFVHLNTSIPGHLESNIRTTVKQFPIHQVALIHNLKFIPKQVTRLPIIQFKYTPDLNWTELDSALSHPKNFRGNFWLTSAARFFALEQFAKTVNEEILHLESDVIISEDFPFHRLSTLDKSLAFPLISEERGVGSVIYLRNAKSCRLLCSNILDEAKKNSQTTEMIESIQLLPIGPSVPNAYVDSSKEYISQLLDSSRLLKGAFDGVDIGQYFLGTDPKNRRGRVLLRNNLVNGFADIGKWKIEYNSGREFLDVSLHGSITKTPLYALHVAVKETRYFELRSRAKALKKAVRMQQDAAGSYISFAAFFRSVRDSAKRKVTRFLRTEKYEF
jgi:hypothetical protein